MQLNSVFANLPTTLITKHEPVEVSVAFVALGGFLAGGSLLLGAGRLAAAALGLAVREPLDRAPVAGDPDGPGRAS